MQLILSNSNLYYSNLSIVRTKSKSLSILKMSVFSGLVNNNFDIYFVKKDEKGLKVVLKSTLINLAGKSRKIRHLLKNYFEVFFIPKIIKIKKHSRAFSFLPMFL